MGSKFAVVALMGACFLALVFLNRNSVEPLSTKAPPAKFLKAKQITKTLLNEPRPPVVEPQLVKVSSSCSKVWDQIQSLTTSDFENLKFPSISACQNVPAEFSVVTMKYIDACKKLNEGAVLTDREKSDCRAALYTYRATITDYNTREENIDQISDLRVLIDKLISSFNAGVDPDTDRILRVAERIHRLEPDLYEPMKAIVVAKFDPIFKGERDPVRLADTFAAIEKAAAEAEEFNTADPDLWEAKFLARSRLGQDLDRADQVVDDMRRVKGLEGLSDYFQAGIEWRRGNAELAASLLDRALKRDPKNERYLATQEKMKDAKPGAKELFSSSVRFSFDFDVDKYKN